MTWGETRARAVEAFGSFPSPDDEATVLEAWKRHPVAVGREVDSVAARHAQGTLRQPWRILALNVASRHDGETPAPNALEREAVDVVAKAEQWLRNCGYLFDTWAEVRDELLERGLGGGMRSSTRVPEEALPSLQTAWESARERDASSVDVGMPSPTWVAARAASLDLERQGQARVPSPPGK